MCVIDTETTGLDDAVHEIIEVCVMPLDTNIKPVGLPFHMFLLPTHIETSDSPALEKNKTTKHQIMSRGVDSMKAADAFHDWFMKLGLPEGKKIEPLGHNLGFDLGFIQKWLGFANFSYYFNYHKRDTAAIALYLNDRADLRAERYPFPKVNLSYLCSQLNVINLAPHTALGDCLATAEVYRKLLLSGPLTL
jgi:DNA polymerase III epsilon subunit-like protein